MGASRAVDTARERSAEVMAELKMTEGFDVGLEMRAVPAAFTGMLEHMNHGGKVALLGLLPAGTAIDWTKVIFKGRSCVGHLWPRDVRDVVQDGRRCSSGLDCPDGDPPLPGRLVRSRLRRRHVGQ